MWTSGPRLAAYVAITVTVRDYRQNNETAQVALEYLATRFGHCTNQIEEDSSGRFLHVREFPLLEASWAHSIAKIHDRLPHQDHLIDFLGAAW
jgi:hypothetical protein